MINMYYVILQWAHMSESECLWMDWVPESCHAWHFFQIVWRDCPKSTPDENTRCYVRDNQKWVLKLIVQSPRGNYMIILTEKFQKRILNLEPSLRTVIEWLKYVYCSQNDESKESRRAGSGNTLQRKGQWEWVWNWCQRKNDLQIC